MGLAQSKPDIPLTVRVTMMLADQVLAAVATGGSIRAGWKIIKILLGRSFEIKAVLLELLLLQLLLLHSLQVGHVHVDRLGNH